MRVRGRSRCLLHSYATNSCRNSPTRFGIWRVLKRLRLISGKATFFSRQEGQIQLWESRGVRRTSVCRDGILAVRSSLSSGFLRIVFTSSSPSEKREPSRTAQRGRDPGVYQGCLLLRARSPKLALRNSTIPSPSSPLPGGPCGRRKHKEGSASRRGPPYLFLGVFAAYRHKPRSRFLRLRFARRRNDNN
jgi:hypothetical protein